MHSNYWKKQKYCYDMYVHLNATFTGQNIARYQTCKKDHLRLKKFINNGNQSALCISDVRTGQKSVSEAKDGRIMKGYKT